MQPKRQAIQAPANSEHWRFAVHESCETAAAHWDAFATTAVGLPYQKRPWVEAWLPTIGRAEGLATRIVLVYDESGRLIALLPLALQSWRGLGMLQFVGGKHANYQLPLFDQERFVLPDSTGARLFLVRLALEVGGVDLVLIRNQPAAWRGVANPLALGATTPAHDRGYRTDLEPDPEAFLRTIFSSDTRKKLKKKRRLLEANAPISFVKATTPHLAEHILAAFHRQKSQRLASRNLINPFEAPGAASFLRNGALSAHGSGHDAIQLFALLLGDRVVSTFGGTGDGQTFCGMFNSFDADPDISRSSPGELILVELVSHLCQAGYSSFDLGVGDAPYKLAYCKEQIALVDTVLATTSAGALLSRAVDVRDQLKGIVKRNPRIMRAVGHAQRLFGARAGRPERADQV